MNINSKKIYTVIHYSGLILGSVLFSVFFIKETDFSLQLAGYFQKLDKLLTINQKDLLIYVCSQRLKQAGIMFVLYYCFSSLVMNFSLILYLSVVSGVMISSFFYYYNYMGLVAITILLVPVYAAFLVNAWFIKEIDVRREKKKKITIQRIVVLLIILTITSSLLEITVNYWFADHVINNISFKFV